MAFKDSMHNKFCQGWLFSDMLLVFSIQIFHAVSHLDLFSSNFSVFQCNFLSLTLVFLKTLYTKNNSRHDYYLCEGGYDFIGVCSLPLPSGYVFIEVCLLLLCLIDGEQDFPIALLQNNL